MSKPACREYGRRDDLGELIVLVEGTDVGGVGGK